MPKQKKDKKPAADVNILAEYLISESAREVGGPDAATDSQIELLMDESEADQEAEQQRDEAKRPVKTAAKTQPVSASRKPSKKATKSPGKKKR